MGPTKELKPPQEMVDAIQNSEDMTAPAEFSTSSEFTQDTPRALRNRLVHEEVQRLSKEAGGPQGGQHLSKQELKDHMQEVKMMQHDKERHNTYDRNHPGIGGAGRGDEGASSSVLKRGEAGGHMRYGHD
ncbi:hypothetical protein PLESTB_001219400 [Pleodorina starrii]|uniref:Uncharacterized protein n=1 Tax=Pleodorina starrii TaxID=330485 RepID=A0A9W6F6A5_9CHLO|nr:hypothetical protein PLESTM_002059500 [Pleodorina starrii]GLC57390.1 hypothetical protein PLESTB_001219400 [Pleodorina starrii]